MSVREGAGWENMYNVSEGGGRVGELEKHQGIIVTINLTGIQSVCVCHFPIPDKCMTAT